MTVHDPDMGRSRKIREIRDPIHYLRAWRRYRGLTQEQLAERAGISHSTVSRVENGESDLTRTTAAPLAAALKIRTADLFRDPADPDDAWSTAAKIAALSPERRRILARFLASLAEDDTG